MAGSGRLQSDPLFQGLTRPTMIFGVSYMFFVVNAVVTMMFFINLQSFKILLFVAPTIHLIGFLICRNEPRAIEFLLLKAARGMRCINRGYHRNTNSYDVY